MFMITAIIQPFRLEHVRAALISEGLSGMTVHDCVGHGRQPKLVPSLKGGPDLPDIMPKVKIQVAVPSERRDAAIDAIIRGARLGNIGDGKIFVSPLERVMSIRTGLEDGLAEERAAEQAHIEEAAA
jgi:nitrogen regulatory protein PII